LQRGDGGNCVADFVEVKKGFTVRERERDREPRGEERIWGMDGVMFCFPE